MAEAGALRLQFEDDTAYETLVLTSLRDVRQIETGRPTEARDDLRGASKNFVRGLSASIGAGTARAAVEPFRPLVFGAAYKVLDLAVELVMTLNASPQPGGRWTFVAKLNYVRATPSPATLPAPINGAPALWARFSALYDRLLEPRHAVVHRRVQQDAAGNFQPHDPEGLPLAAIRADDIESFALAVYGLREVIVRNAPDERRLNAIAWHLDALDGLHGLDRLGAAEPAPIARVIEDNLESTGAGHWRINVKKISDHLASQDGVRFADLALHARQDGSDTVFIARFEELPEGQDSIEFDEAALPPWLQASS